MTSPPICSVLIPTRARPERLHKAIMSMELAFGEDIDFWVRSDLDDVETRDASVAMSKPWIKFFAGERRNGYASLAEFYGELASMVTAPWIWIMNDDAHVLVERMDFGDLDLRAWLGMLPIEGVIVQPEIYGLNASKYPRCEGGAFPIVPTRVWERFGHTMPSDPIDTWLDHLLRAENGWRTEFLPGVTVQHDRDTDDVLAEHRKL